MVWRSVQGNMCLDQGMMFWWFGVHRLKISEKGSQFGAPQTEPQALNRVWGQCAGDCLLELFREPADVAERVDYLNNLVSMSTQYGFSDMSKSPKSLQKCNLQKLHLLITSPSPSEEPHHPLNNNYFPRM